LFAEEDSIGFDEAVTSAVEAARGLFAMGDFVHAIFGEGRLAIDTAMSENDQDTAYSLH
jgi:hypothetical protein